MCPNLLAALLWLYDLLSPGCEQPRDSIDGHRPATDTGDLAFWQNVWSRGLHECMLSHSVDSCDPMDYSLPESSVHVIFQARIPEWVAISFSRGSSDPGTEPLSLTSPALAGRFFATDPPVSEASRG